MLLDIDCVKFSFNNYFTLTSGLKSPVYVDCRKIISFVNERNKRHDFVSKEWGFYATPSINSRLKSEGFKTALVKNKKNQIYIMVVEETQMELFKLYCEN